MTTPFDIEEIRMTDERYAELMKAANKDVRPIKVVSVETFEDVIAQEELDDILRDIEFEDENPPGCA